MKAKVIVYIKEDIEGTWFVSATRLEDGKDSSAKYPRKYLQLQKDLDVIFPHKTKSELIKYVQKQVRADGYIPVIRIDP